MTTQSRMEANQANAQHSTGPTSACGKAKVSQNARTHGLTAVRLNINPEDQPFFDELRAAQLVELTPQSSTEQHLFEEILHSMWRIEKIRIIQSDLLDEEGLDGIETEDLSIQKQHDRLERYHTRSQSTWFRCHKMLKVVQNERIAKQTQTQAEAVVAVPETPPEQPVTNQTQPTRSAAEAAGPFGVGPDEFPPMELLLQLGSIEIDTTEGAAKADNLV